MWVFARLYKKSSLTRAVAEKQKSDQEHSIAIRAGLKVASAFCETDDLTGVLCCVAFCFSCSVLERLRVWSAEMKLAMESIIAKLGGSPDFMHVIGGNSILPQRLSEQLCLVVPPSTQLHFITTPGPSFTDVGSHGCAAISSCLPLRFKFNAVSFRAGLLRTAPCHFGRSKIQRQVLDRQSMPWSLTPASFRLLLDERSSLLL